VIVEFALSEGWSKRTQALAFDKRRIQSGDVSTNIMDVITGDDARFKRLAVSIYSKKKKLIATGDFSLRKSGSFPSVAVMNVVKLKEPSTRGRPAGRAEVMIKIVPNVEAKVVAAVDETNAVNASSSGLLQVLLVEVKLSTASKGDVHAVVKLPAINTWEMKTSSSSLSTSREASWNTQWRAPKTKSSEYKSSKLLINLMSKDSILAEALVDLRSSCAKPNQAVKLTSELRKDKQLLGQVSLLVKFITEDNLEFDLDLTPTSAGDEKLPPQIAPPPAAVEPIKAENLPIPAKEKVSSAERDKLDEVVESFNVMKKRVGSIEENLKNQIKAVCNFDNFCLFNFSELLN